MKIEIITDVTTEPITLSEVKGMLRVTGNAHDTPLTSMITSARVYMERALNKNLAVKTMKVTTDEELDELPYGPVNTLISAEEDDGDYIYTYTSGYTALPEDIKQGLFYLIKHWFDIDDVASAVPESVNRVIQLNTNCPML